MRQNRSGFSLLEIALVLAIIGLLIGGIVASRSLIRTAEVRKVLVDAKTYATSVHQFKQKYGELPGDFAAAANVWGNTENGDGDGVVEPPAGAGLTGENFQLWNHLQLAGFIAGSFTGLAGGGGIHHTIPGTNAPLGSINSSGFWYYGWGYQAGGAIFYEGDYTNVMTFGKATSSNWPNGPALTGKEAYEIDHKIDDGSPAFGSVRTHVKTWMDATIGECTDSDTPTAADYIRNPTAGVTHGCSLLFMHTFMAPKES